MSVRWSLQMMRNIVKKTKQKHGATGYLHLGISMQDYQFLSSDKNAYDIKTKTFDSINGLSNHLDFASLQLQDFILNKISY